MVHTIQQAGPLKRGGLSVGAQYDRQPPTWVSQVLSKFGKNPYNQPIFRVVWSEGRLEQVLLYTGRYGWQQRYEGDPCWILEKWLPTSYSREMWYEKFAVQVSDPVSSELWSMSYLGPYLEHGDYHACYRLERHGVPMQLTMAIVEYYCRLIEHGKEYSILENILAQRAIRAREKRDWERKCDDVFDDSQPAFGVGAVMSGYGGKTADRVKPEDVNLASVDSLPDWVPRTPGFRQV